MGDVVELEYHLLERHCVNSQCVTLEYRGFNRDDVVRESCVFVHCALHTISNSEKKCLCTGAGLRHTQAASWASDWTVHSRRKKLAQSHSHTLWMVLRIWQQSRESSERRKELCRSWNADRFFTAKPGDTGEEENELEDAAITHIF